MLVGIAGLLALIGLAFLVGGYKQGYRLLSVIGDGCMLAAFVALFLRVHNLI
ncbi:hypothetical protein D3C76_165500 [compost metagenome]